MKKVRLAILASGSGSNAEAIMKWAAHSNLASIVCLGSDKRKAFALTRACKFEIPTFTIKKMKDESREAFDTRLLNELNTFSPDWIVLAGYMKLLSHVLLDSYKNRIINIHPSLLPLFPGTDGYGDAFKAGVKESGCTVHYVDEGMDTGKIIAQKTIPLLPGETLQDFKSRGLQIENEFYPMVIEKLLKENYELSLSC